jgi:hypothetical protein
VVAAQPDAILAEVGTCLDRPFGTSTVDLWLLKLGMSYKKTLFAAEQNRPDVAEKRAHWHKHLAGEASCRLVFMDESGANTKMTRLRGRSLVLAKGWWPKSAQTLSDYDDGLCHSPDGALGSLPF